MSKISFFITSVKPERLEDYKKLAEKMADLWIEHGALEIQEFIGESTPYGKVTSYPRAVNADENDIIITGFVRFAKEEDKAIIMDKIMSAPDMQEMFQNAPMDGANMIFGEFNQLLERK